MAAVNPQAASIQAGLATAAQLQQQIAALTGGGPTAAAPGGAAAATAPGNVVPGQPQILQGTTVQGKAVTVVKDEQGYKLNPPTGQLEVVTNVDGKLLRFDAQGKYTRSFTIADQQVTKVTLDYREGISSGISNLSRLIAGRQERIKSLSDALTSDANDTGSINQTDLQRLTQENQTTENITGMQKKIYDAVQNSIQVWLR